MSKFRIWYASRDPYHCIFRMIRLLDAKGGPIPIEQLKILDMFLMFPSLLHRLNLTASLRDKLRNLREEAPAQSFVRLPGTASVWQDLQIYQLTALKRLVGLGVVDRQDVSVGNANLDRLQTPPAILEQVMAQNKAADPLMRFLVHDLAALPLTGSQGLIRRAGLPSRGPIA